MLRGLFFAIFRHYGLFVHGNSLFWGENGVFAGYIYNGFWDETIKKDVRI